MDYKEGSGIFLMKLSKCSRLIAYSGFLPCIYMKQVEFPKFQFGFSLVSENGSGCCNPVLVE